MTTRFAGVFWDALPFPGIALILALTLKQIPLSDTTGIVARGQAVGGAEAELLEAERHAARHAIQPAVDGSAQAVVASARRHYAVENHHPRR